MKLIFSLSHINGVIFVFQVQGGGFQKKVRNNHWKSGRKKQKKVLSEK